LNGAVYVADCDWLRENRTFVTSETVGYPMPADRSLDIDTVEDVQELRRLVGENVDGSLSPSPRC